jgi:parallel beta-helix repeat protein
MNGRSIVTGGAALLLAFLLFIAGIALITAEQQQQSSSNSATGILDAAALPAAAQQWIPYIEQAGELCPQITAPLLAAQEEAESGFNSKAVRPGGAEGIAQFLPSTWPTWSEPATSTGPDTPFNAPDAILAEGRYMCALAAQMAALAQSSGTDVVSLALAAYNAGSAAVIAAGGIPQNGQTPAYVQRVEALEASFTITLADSGGGGTAGVGTPLPCPAGAVPVSPGEAPPVRPNTAYCFGAGTWNGLSIVPQDGDGFYGGGHAVLDGDGEQSAFISGGAVSDMTIDGFTITGYFSGSNFQPPGTIELRSGNNDDISNNNITGDRLSGIETAGGAALGDYSAGVNNSTITHNTLSNIGYSGMTVSGSTNMTVSYNDVSSTDTEGSDHEDDVAAVGKFAVDSGTKVIGNYVHNNPDHGIWFDVFDINNLVQGNRVIDNNVSGIFIEEAGVTLVTENTADGNGFEDIHAPGNPGAGISVSSSSPVTVTNNVLVGNLIPGVAQFVGHAGLPVDVIQSGNTDTPQPVLASSTGPTPFGLAAVEAAAGELGVPYSWGGGNDAGPSLGIAQGAGTVGFDCSGLVLYAVSKASAGTIQLPHSSEVQATDGQAVSKADIEPGDVIAFALNGGSDFDHIGIYVGDNEMIDAPHTDGVVRIDNLDLSYWQSVPWSIRSFG